MFDVLGKQFPQVMIMAAGKGDRMRPLTERLPKPLIPVDLQGRCGLELTLDALAPFKFERLIVNGYYLKNYISDYLNARYPHVMVSLEDEPLETGGGLLHALPLLDTTKPLLILNSDAFIDNLEQELHRLMDAFHTVPHNDQVIALMLGRLFPEKGFGLGHGSRLDYGFDDCADQDHHLGLIHHWTRNPKANYVFIGPRILGSSYLQKALLEEHQQKSLNGLSFSQFSLFEEAEVNQKLFGFLSNTPWASLSTMDDIVSMRRYLSPSSDGDTKAPVVKKQVSFSSYNDAWPLFFDQLQKDIQKADTDNILIDIHHVGSTSIPGLSAKPILDLIVVVSCLDKAKNLFYSLNFDIKSEFNIPKRLYVSGFDQRFQMEFHIAVYLPDHPEIELNLLFRNYLRENPVFMRQYEALKHLLYYDPKNHEKQTNRFMGYTLGKYDLIQRFLKNAGYQACRMVRPNHPKEWDTYHQLMKELLFNDLPVVYDPLHPSLTSSSFDHFVFYQGVDRIGAAQIEFLNDDVIILRFLAIDLNYQNHGAGSHFLALIEDFSRYKNRKIIKTHADQKALGFYQSQGYTLMDFDDMSIRDNTVSLGKYL